MKDFDALKSLWHKEAALPKVDFEELRRHVQKTNYSLAAKLVPELLTMVLAIILLSFIWLFSPFKMWTTHLAMCIFILCCLYYIFSLYRNYRSIRTGNPLDKPEIYILSLKKYKKERYKVNTRNYRVYTLLLTTGFLLLFIEIAFMASPLLTILGILFTMFWIFLCYTLMGKYIRKEQATLAKVILDLERLQQQFEDK